MWKYMEKIPAGSEDSLYQCSSVSGEAYLDWEVFKTFLRETPFLKGRNGRPMALQGMKLCTQSQQEPRAAASHVYGCPVPHPSLLLALPLQTHLQS